PRIVIINESLISNGPIQSQCEKAERQTHTSYANVPTAKSKGAPSPMGHCAIQRKLSERVHSHELSPKVRTFVVDDNAIGTTNYLRHPLHADFGAADWRIFARTFWPRGLISG